VDVETAADALHEQLVPQLERGEVDRHGEVPETGHGTAGDELAERVLEDPAADLADEVALLGDRDEPFREQHAEAGMRPAH